MCLPNVTGVLHTYTSSLSYHDSIVVVSMVLVRCIPIGLTGKPLDNASPVAASTRYQDGQCGYAWCTQWFGVIHTVKLTNLPASTVIDYRCGNTNSFIICTCLYIAIAMHHQISCVSHR